MVWAKNRSQWLMIRDEFELTPVEILVKDSYAIDDAQSFLLNLGVVALS